MEQRLGDNEKAKIMSQTAKSFTDILKERIKQNQDVLLALTSNWPDQVPDSVKLHREEEAARLRAVIAEENSLLAIYTALYPS